MKALKDLFIEELTDMYDAEHRILKALPRLIKAATADDLKQGLLLHLKETEGHVKKLQQVFQCFNEKARGRTCTSMMGLLEEADEVATDFRSSPIINAALISAAQKVEHYEMATYGCLREWAGLLGNEEAGSLLQEILEEETAADEKLTELARAGSNREALGEDEGSPDAAISERPGVRSSALHR
jgi:ferritin-like metal-binding protein YciE